MTNKILPSTSEFIDKYGLDAKKSLGQNFILDKNFTDKIAKSALEENKSDFNNEIILEIGPGPASLTRSILDLNPKKLIVIEKDRRCIKILEEIQEFYGSDKLEIINQDALEINEESLLNSLSLNSIEPSNNEIDPKISINEPNHNITVKSQNLQENHIKNQENSQKLYQNETKIKAISNLPYNVGTVLLIKWLKNHQLFSSLTLMLQKEVAERIAANPNDKNYGRISIISGLLADRKILFEVNKNIFTPPPKVTSAIIQIKPYQKPIFDIEIEKLEKITALAFNQRRKMIRSSLKNVDFIEKHDQILQKLSISGDLRPENLTIEQFCKIAEFLK